MITKVQKNDDTAPRLSGSSELPIFVSMEKDKYYRHFKGGVYRLVGIAKDSETLEDMVVYQAMYGDHQLWVRPKEMFFGKVERDGKVFERFTEIGPEEG